MSQLCYTLFVRTLKLRRHYFTICQCPVVNIFIALKCGSLAGILLHARKEAVPKQRQRIHFAFIETETHSACGWIDTCTTRRIIHSWSHHWHIFKTALSSVQFLSKDRSNIFEYFKCNDPVGGKKIKFPTSTTNRMKSISMFNCSHFSGNCKCKFNGLYEV